MDQASGYSIYTVFTPSIKIEFISVLKKRIFITGMSCWAQRILGRRRGAKWHYTAPPPRRAMGPAGTVDGTIGRFLLPIGGALLRLLGHFVLI